jgi:hypothetical protein
MKIAVHPNLVASRSFRMLEITSPRPHTPLIVSFQVITHINSLGNWIIAGHTQQLVM